MTILQHISLEEDASGQTKPELERTFYARIKPGARFLNAVPEEQEQWEARFPKTENNQAAARIRVRKTTYPDGKIEYVQTIKINEDGSKVGNSKVAETSFEVTADVFEQFKRFATNGMHKWRYTLQCGNDEQGDSGDFKLEIDTFKLFDGRFANWCKIDYEYAQGQPCTPPYFPSDAFSEIIAGDSEDPEDQKHIRQLYDDLFLLKNAQ